MFSVSLVTHFKLLLDMQNACSLYYFGDVLDGLSFSNFKGMG